MKNILLVCLILLSFNLGLLTYSVFDYLENNKVITYQGVIELENIIFKFENSSTMDDDVVGIAFRDREGNKIVTLLSNMSYENTLRVCNHEVLHLLLCMKNEEKFVDILDDYIRFEVCNELMKKVMV